jgi:enamine deaminase RidA (YjgF/YER057c/UK114 family)
LGRADPVTVERHRTAAPGGASYSDAVVLDAAGVRWIHVAGQTPRVAPPDRVPADLAGQTELCFRQMESILGVWGATLADVVQLTVFRTDLEDYASFAAVRARVFGGDPPSSAAVGVASLLDRALVEIVALAVTPAPG